MIKDKSGNVLILTLIVFAVIIIGGTGLFTKVLSTQNISVMQQNKQQAYYIAKSGLDACVEWILGNPSEANKIIELSKKKSVVGKGNMKDIGECELTIDTTDKIIEVKSVGVCGKNQVKVKSHVLTAVLEQIEVKGSGETTILPMGHVEIPYVANQYHPFIHDAWKNGSNICEIAGSLNIGTKANEELKIGNICSRGSLAISLGLDSTLEIGDICIGEYDQVTIQLAYEGQRAKIIGNINVHAKNIYIGKGIDTTGLKINLISTAECKGKAHEQSCRVLNSTTCNEECQLCNGGEGGLGEVSYDLMHYK